MKKTILITGGTGYIGSHGVVAFEQAGYKTVIVDNLSNSSLKTLDGIEKIIGYKPDFYEVDLREQTSPQASPLEEREQNSPQPSPLGGEGVGQTSPLTPLLQGDGNRNNIINGRIDKNFYSLQDIFKKYDFDGVLHFAGLKAVGESCEKPLEYFDNNLVGSIKLFETMQDFGVKNIIFSSSATVYDALKSKIPFSEKDFTGNTTNPYGTTKFLIENILSDLAKFADFRVMNLRYFNPIGAHKSGFIGEEPDGIPNNLLPYIMQVITGKLEFLKIFGDDYDTIDGTGVRDYRGVNDLIDGHLKAYKYLEERKPHPNPPLIGEGKIGFMESINLGVGKGISVLEMLKACEKVVGKEIKYKILERRTGDLAEVYCNPEKARGMLDWKAEISLEESLENSLRFYGN